VLPVRDDVPPPTMTATKVSWIVKPCVGIADKRSVVPQLSILPPKTMWADMLHCKIKVLMPALYEEVTQHIVNGVVKGDKKIVDVYKYKDLKGALIMAAIIIFWIAIGSSQSSTLFLCFVLPFVMSCQLFKL